MNQVNLHDGKILLIAARKKISEEEQVDCIQKFKDER